VPSPKNLQKVNFISVHGFPLQQIILRIAVAVPAVAGCLSLQWHNFLLSSKKGYEKIQQPPDVIATADPPDLLRFAEKVPGIIKPGAGPDDAEYRASK
jgi:hypothetical protein